MRALFAGIVLAVLPAIASAQSLPYLGTIADPEVLVRAGPSDKFPETGTLKRGVEVVVDREEFGWLAIKAPKGSVSWVPIAFVDFDSTLPTPQNVMVTEDVTLASGRVGLAQPLAEIRKTKVPAGSTLLVIGQRVTFDNKQWYPVEPIHGDVRYIPKSAVKAGEPVNTAFVVRDMAPPGLTPIAATTPHSEIPPANIGAKPGVNHPLWTQAEAAERDGRSEDAEKLYFQLARLMNEPGGDHDVANLCYTRIHSIREKKRIGSVPATANIGTTPAFIPVVRPESSKPDRPSLLPPVRNDQPTGTQNTTTPTSTDRGNWTGVGRLVSTPLALDGRPTYALETAPGIAQLYVVAGNGINLKAHLNRRVNLQGVTYTHPNAQKPYIVATDVTEEK